MNTKPWKIRRENLKMTQLDLALKVGVHHSSVSDFECNKRIPNYQVLAKLAEALGYATVAECLADAEKTPPDPPKPPRRAKNVPVLANPEFDDVDGYLPEQFIRATKTILISVWADKDANRVVLAHGEGTWSLTQAEAVVLADALLKADTSLSEDRHARA